MVSSKKMALAYSGGLDSRFLAQRLIKEGVDLLLLNAIGPHIAQSDTEYAGTWARKNGLRCLHVPFDPLGLLGIDTKNRCYVCKKQLFRTIKAFLRERNEGDRILCDGTNRDDKALFRPGLKAILEENVRSPLDEAGLGKAEIRKKAKECGLENADQKPRPCLLTRLAYGMTADAQTLARIAETEKALEQALTARLGMTPDIRLRLTPQPLLQLETMPDDFLPGVRDILDHADFLPCSLRIGGAVSGFFDRDELSDDKERVLYLER